MIGQMSIILLDFAECGLLDGLNEGGSCGHGLFLA